MKHITHIAAVALAILATACSGENDNTMPSKAVDSLRSVAPATEEAAPQDSTITGEVVDVTNRTIVLDVDSKTVEVELPEAFDGEKGEIGDNVTVHYNGDSVVAVDVEE